MERELLAILRVDDGIVRSCVSQPFFWGGWQECYLMGILLRIRVCKPRTHCE